MPDGRFVVIGTSRGPGTLNVASSTAYRSSDVGVTWSSSALPAAAGCFCGTGPARSIVQVAAANTALVAVGYTTDSYPVSVSSDGAVSWTLGGTLTFDVTDVDDDGSDAILVAAGPKVRRSADGGATWTLPTTAVPLRAGATGDFHVSQRGDDVVVVVGPSVGGVSVSVSHDRGLTWADAAGQPPGAPTIFAVSD
jgi:hypothetical protein